MNKETKLVEAICDGIVLDHIPARKLFPIVKLLQLDELSTPVTIGNNLSSSRLERKGLIKMSDHFISPRELDKIALIAPEVHLSIIRNYEVVEKRQVALPLEVVGLIRCPNPKCITNAEPMQTLFHIESPAEGEEPCVECHYCGRKCTSSSVELL